MSVSIAERVKGRSELGIAVGLFVAACLVLYDASQIETSAAQRGPVGPAAVPTLIGALLLVVAVFLAVDVLRGGHGELEAGEDIDLSHGSDWRTVLLLAASFLANVLLIERVGWPISGAVLFFGCAFALGSRKYALNAVIAVIMSVGSYFLFARVLGIELPAGWLEGVI